MNIPIYTQATTVNNLGNIAPASTPQVTTAGYQGLAQAGQSLTQVGAQQADNVITNQVDLTQRAQEAATVNAFNTTTQAHLEIAKQWQDIQNSATGAATGSTDQILATITDKRKTLLETNPDPVAQRLINHEFEQMTQQYGMQGLDFENKMFTNYKANEVTQTAQNLTNLVYQDPNQYAASMARMNAAIDSSGLPEPLRMKQKEMYKEQIDKAWLNNMLNNNPRAGLNMIDPALGKLPEGSVQSQVSDTARKAGLDPLYALSVTGIESGFDTSAKSKTSSASGLVQMTSDTRKQLGLPENATLEQQMQAFTQLTNSNRLQLSGSLGHEPTDTQLYLAHHFGATGAAEILQADRNTPINQVVSDKVMKANSYLAGKTVGQVIDINAKKYNSERAKYIDKEQQAVNQSSPINNMPAELLAQYRGKFEQAVETQQQVQAVNIAGMVKDHEAMAMNGNMNFTPASFEQFSAMYPKEPEKAARAYQDYTNTIQLGKDINSVNALTPDQEAKLYSSYTPNSEFGYAGNLEKQQILGKAIQIKHQQLTEDPAAWVIKNDPGIKGASDLPGIIAAQQKQGIKYPSLMTKSQEQGIIADLSNKKGEDKANYLSALQQQYGANFGLIARQLQLNKDLPSGLASMMLAPTPYAAKMAATVADVDVDTLKKAIDGKDIATIDDEVLKSMENFNKSLPLEQMDSTSYNDVKNTITKLAYNNFRSGMNTRDSANKSVELFIGSDKYNFINNTKTDFMIRVPIKYNQHVVKNNLNKFIQQIAFDDLDPHNRNIVDPFTLKRNEAGYVDLIKKNSYWITNADESGVNMYFMGRDNKPYAVLDKSGKQFSKTFNEILLIGDGVGPEETIQSGRLAAQKGNFK